MNQAATLWLVCALIALATEFASGTLYLLVAACALAGGGIAAWREASGSLQFLAASATGTLAYLAVAHWKRHMQPASKAQADHPDLGQEVTVVRITGPGRARVFYRGTQWDADFSGPPPAVNSRARITGQDSNRLTIESTPEKDNE
jgi:membrane protein implicated in regulation of membrane protease activity